MRPISIKLFPVVLIFFLLLPACSSNQEASSGVISWQTYGEGLQAAGTQDKKVFLYFRADW